MATTPLPTNHGRVDLFVGNVVDYRTGKGDKLSRYTNAVWTIPRPSYCIWCINYIQLFLERDIYTYTYIRCNIMYSTYIYYDYISHLNKGGWQLSIRCVFGSPQRFHPSAGWQSTRSSRNHERCSAPRFTPFRLGLCCCVVTFFPETNEGSRVLWVGVGFWRVWLCLPGGWVSKRLVFFLCFSNSGKKQLTRWTIFGWRLRWVSCWKEWCSGSWGGCLRKYLNENDDVFDWENWCWN